MRCSCCNKNLNDWESTARDLKGNFVDTCNGCRRGLGLSVIGRPDLEQAEAPPADWFDVGDPFIEPLIYDDEDDWRDL